MCRYVFHHYIFSVNNLCNSSPYIIRSCGKNRFSDSLRNAYLISCMFTFPYLENSDILTALQESLELIKHSIASGLLISLIDLNITRGI